MTESSLTSRAAAGAAALWNAAARVRIGLYRRGLLPKRRLNAKVISIGNIAWGGTGKTPFTIWLARRLADSGLRLSILTRGHRRTSRARVHIIPPHTPPEDASDAGDEVQLYLRNLRDARIPIGVAASRYEAGKLLEEQFPVDVHLLDDGFQHVALARDLDLALVDAENPWGRRGAFSSLLRESPAALARADAVLLTRCELLDSASGPNSVEGLRAALLRCNPRAEFFAVRTELIGFRGSPDNGLLHAEKFRLLRPFAFCELGNPRAFFRTLEQAGIALVGQKTFPDHHRYGASDLAALERTAAAGADCLLTTEKDWVNLPVETSLRLPLYWTEIGLRVEEESRLLRWISRRLELPEPGPSDAALGRADQENPRARMVSESKLGRL